MPSSRENSRKHRKRSSDDERKGEKEKTEKRRRRSSSRDRPTVQRQEKRKDEGGDGDDWLAKKRNTKDNQQTRAGGAYIPPAKLKLMQQQIADKSSEQYQRLAWEHLKKRIHGHVNKINVANIVPTVTALLRENIILGKGLFTRSVIQAQSFSPTFSHVYAALVSVINSKFPHIGELLLRRLIIQFKRSFRTNDKKVAITCTKFIAHLINQQMVHELLALEILTLLVENATDDSIEIAIAFLKEVGSKLSELSPRGMNAIFDRLRHILSEAQIDQRVQYMIEVMFMIRKDKFKAYPSVIEDLDLVEEEDQITHTISLDDTNLDPENILNVFRLNPEFAKNEEMYEEIKKEILGEGSDAGSDGEDGDDDEEAPEGEIKGQTAIIDNTEMNLVAFRRTVYLTIQSSLDYQEAIHKLLKMEIKPGMELELCNMILDCCAQQRTYEKFYGLMAERLCRLKKDYQTFFEQIFRDSYDIIHRFEMTKLRNVTNLFAHLLYTDAITWTVLGHIKLNEDDTTSAGRIFIKLLFQELSQFLGLEKLYDRIQDPTLQEAFDGLFPRNNPRDTRFSINFFTAIGLGGLTVDLREHLKSGAVE